MHSKALHFGDISTAKEVMDTSEPVKQKHLGKAVHNYNKDQWQAAVPVILEKGLVAKFTQVLKCKEFLKATKDQLLGEANPNDKFFGIGLALHSSNVWDQAKWGNNLLGKCLMNVRDQIK